MEVLSEELVQPEMIATLVAIVPRQSKYLKAINQADAGQTGHANGR